LCVFCKVCVCLYVWCVVCIVCVVYGVCVCVCSTNACTNPLNLASFC
jgi:hypothetical protein